MSDYIYKSNLNENFEEQINEDNQDNVECTKIEASTTLDELDQIEILNRHADEYSQIPTIDNPYPDILKKPLFTKVLPDNIPRPIKSNPPSKKPINFSDLSIKEFANTIANSLVDIINDLLIYKTGDDLTLIFTKDTRLLSIGVVFIIVSIFMIFFKNIE